jgi:hypothetical protein
MNTSTRHVAQAREARPGVRSLRLIIVPLLLWSVVIRGEPVDVRYPEGPVHGLLVLRTLDGALLANGELTQVTRGSRVTTRVTFRFKDGSLHDETVVFSQDGRFRLLRDHLVQNGPTFPRAIDMSIDGASGEVSVRYDDHGEEKQVDERLDLSADLANGLIPIVLKNVQADAPPRGLSMVVATPKPRLVHLLVESARREPFLADTENRTASHYVVKVEIGGVAGRLAPLFGKQPPDSHVWILDGAAPAFVRSEQPFYVGGPSWRIDLVSTR